MKYFSMWIICLIAFVSCSNENSLLGSAVLRPLTISEMASFVHNDMRQRGLPIETTLANMKISLDESTDEVFIYKIYGYQAGGYFDYFTMSYDGEIIEYFYNSRPLETYTIELLPDEDRYIIPNKNGTVIVLSYLSSDYPQYFIHYKLSNTEVRFLENIFGTSDLGNNLFINDNEYRYLKSVIKNLSNDSVTDGSLIGTNSFLNVFVTGLYGFARSGALFEANSFLDGFNVDVLPENLYPVNDKRAKDRLFNDIRTSKAFLILIENSAMEYGLITRLDNETKKRRLQRINSNMSNGNTSLFNKVFGKDAENLEVKGFVEELNNLFKQ